MSNSENDRLLEEAAYYAESFTGTLMGKLIEHDVEISDLESLRQHIKEARDLEFRLEYNPFEVIDDGVRPIPGFTLGDNDVY